MTAKTIHSMVRVIDEDSTVAFYEKAFGLEGGTEQFARFRVSRRASRPGSSAPVA